MRVIKSKKAKDFIMSIVEPSPTPNGELIFYVEMTPLQVVEAIIIAETELTEHYEQQLQELRDRITNLSICDIDTPVFTHTREFRLHFDYIKKCFTQKLTEKQ